MQICRFAFFTHELLPESAPLVSVARGTTKVVALQAFDHANMRKTLVGAFVDLHVPLEVSDIGVPAIPTQALDEAHTLIETTALLQALATGTSVRVSAPMIAWALVPQSDSDRSLITRLNREVPGVSRLPTFTYRIPEGLLTTALTDRLDGVSLLSEAISQEHPTGRYHDLVRMVERAFALPIYSAREQLTAFLSSDPIMGYSSTEIDLWANSRNPAFHADRRDAFLLSPQLYPITARMLQAAYDILLNKEIWRNPSSGRRKLWPLPQGAAGTNGSTLFTTKGVKVGIRVQECDCLGVLPLDPIQTAPNIPTEWWRPTAITFPRQIIVVDADRKAPEGAGSTGATS